MGEIRVDIISDTHGKLSKELRQELSGADYIIHAGDITSTSDLNTLRSIARVYACLGNNDFSSMYDPSVKRFVPFFIDNVRFQLTHYKEDLDPEFSDVCIFGHTHAPCIEFLNVGANRQNQVFSHMSSAALMAATHAKITKYCTLSYELDTLEPATDSNGALFINPGSPSYPRTSVGPTIARLWIKNGLVCNPQIINIQPPSDSSYFWPF